MKNIFILVGPSGSGKTLLSNYIHLKYHATEFVSTTTRLPRDGEVNGVDYHFVTKETFEICADLMKTGLNNNKIVNALYSMSMNKVNLYADVYSKKIIDNELNYIYYYLPYEKMQELEMTKDETDGIAENLLTIEGIDISMFVREEEDGSKKGSLRCNSKYNVNEIAQLFNGGGHIKAAGFKTNLEFDDIVKKIKEQLIQ